MYCFFIIHCKPYWTRIKGYTEGDIFFAYNSAPVSWIIASVTSGFSLIDINNIILVLRILIILLSSFVLYF